jgi:hypothetical protein
MEFLKATRCTLIASLSLLAVACTTTTAPRSAAGPDDNGANSGGTAANQKNCLNNQNRMNNDAGSVP